MKHQFKSILNKITPIFVKPATLSIAFFTLGVIVITLIFLPTIETNRKEQHNNIYKKALAKGSQIEYEIYRRINYSQALAAYIEQRPDITQVEFESFVSSLLRNDNGIVSSMSSSKDFIIQRIAPYETNKTALGLDLTLKPNRAESIQKCIEGKKTYVEGPSILAQGYSGFIAYTPIYKKEQKTKTLYGVADVVISWEKFLKIAELNQADSLIDIAIRGENGTGENGRVFFGDSAIFHKEDVVKIPIKLPIGEWVLAAYPKQGWTTNLGGFIYVLLACLLGSVVLYFIVRHNVNLVTANEQKYHFILDNSKDTIWAIDWHTKKYTFMSASTVFASGYTANEIVGKKTLGDNVPIEIHDKIINTLYIDIEKYKKGLIDKVHRTFETTAVYKDNVVTWIEVAANIVFNEKREPVEMIGRTTLIDDRKKLEFALKDSEKKFLAITENSDDLIWILDVETIKYTYVSDSAFKLTGYTVDELKELGLTNLFIPEHTNKILQTMQVRTAEITQGKIDKAQEVFEVQIIRKDGSLRWVEISATSVVNKENPRNPIEVVGITRLIEDRKKLEFALKENETKFLAITENSDDLIWMLDVETVKYTYVSDSAFKLTGYTVDELKELDLASSFIPEHANKILQTMQARAVEIMQGKIDKAQEVFEVQMIRKDGSLRWIEISATSVVDKENPRNPIGVVGITRLIEDRKKLEFALKDSEKKFSTINENSDDLIWIIDPNTLKYTYMSESSIKINGYTPEENLERSLSDSFPPEYVQKILQIKDKHVAQLPNAKSRKVQVKFEAPLIRKDKSQVWVEIVATIAGDKKNTGTIKEIIGITRIIEDRKKIELALKESEKKFLAITENSNDLIWILDAKTMKYTYMSESSLKVNGFTSEEATQRTLYDSFGTKDVQNIQQLLKQKTAEFMQGKSDRIQATFEAQLIKKDGGTVWVEISAATIVQKDGSREISEILGMTRVIEDRKKLEQQLVESEKRYAMIVNNVKDVVWTMNMRTFKYTFMSSACYELSGYTPEEYLTMTIADAVPQHSFEIIQGIISQTIADYKAGLIKEMAATFALQQYRKNRELQWVEISAKAIVDETTDEIIEVIAVSRDINERKILEQKLIESETKYKLIVNNTRDIIWTLDIRTLNITFISNNCFELKGYTPEELIGHSIVKLLPPHSLDFVMQLINSKVNEYQSGLSANIEASFEIQQYHKNGSLIWFDISARAIIDETTKKIIEVVAVSRDINEKKKLEHELQESENKYGIIVNNVKDIIWMCNLENLKFTQANKACYDALGYTPEELTQLAISDLVTPDGFKTISSLLEAEYQTFQNTYEGTTLPDFLEIQLYNKNKELIWFEIFAEVTAKEDSEEFNLVGIARNIEYRKKMERQLVESEKRYNFIVNNVRDMIWTCDLNTLNFTYVNDICYELLGYTSNEFTSLNVANIVSPEGFAFLENLLETEIEKFYSNETKAPQAFFEIQLYTKNRKLVWFEMAARIIEEDGQLVEIIGVARDISERKKLEQKIVESEARHTLIASSVKDLIFTCDMDLKYTYMNEACYEVLGYTQEEMLNSETGVAIATEPEGMSIITYFFREQVEKFYAGETDTPQAFFEVQLKPKTGNLIWFEIFAKIIVSEEQELTGVVGIARNIDERKKLEQKLTDSEARYSMIVNNVRDIVWTLDLRTMQYTFMSDACYPITGYTVEEHLQMNSIMDILPPHSAEIIANLISSKIKDYKEGVIDSIEAVWEIQQYHKNGELMWLEVSAKGITDITTKDITEVIAVSRDINERKLLEQKLVESEARYSMIINSTNDLIWTMDIATLRYTFMSNNSHVSMGYTAEEFLSMTLVDVLMPQDLIYMSQLLESLMRDYNAGLISKLEANFDIQLRHKNGTLVWFDVSGIIRDGEIVAVSRDINERKLLEQKLSESEGRYSLIVSNIKDLVLTLSLDLDFLYVNDACYSMLGYTPEEFVKLNIRSVTTEERYKLVADILSAELQKFYAGETDIPQAWFELQLIDRNNEMIWTEVYGKVIISENKEPLNIVAILRDIDHRKKYEKQILDKQNELAALNSSKDMFLSIIAHDLKNPFAALLNMSEYLKTYYYKLNAEKINKYIEIIHASANQAFDLLESLLAWARSSMSSIKYDAKEVNLYELIQKAVQTFDTISIIKRINISIENIPTDINVICDTDRIATVIRNLVSNAIKFSHVDSSIIINVTEYADDADYYLISVKDSGVGIPQEQIKKVFKIDEKISTKGTNNESGTGLGLVLCKEFIDKHNCKIWIESKVGQGTTIFFTIKKA